MSLTEGLPDRDQAPTTEYGWHPGRCTVCSCAVEKMSQEERDELLEIFAGRKKDKYGRSYTDQQVAKMVSRRLGFEHLPWYLVRNCRVNHHGIRRKP